MAFDLYEPKPATDEYLGAVMRSAAACRHKMTDDEWVMVWRHRDRISAYSILFELSIVETELLKPPRRSRPKHRGQQAGSRACSAQQPIELPLGNAIAFA
jgi:hypothetical protein